MNKKQKEIAAAVKREMENNACIGVNNSYYRERKVLKEL